MEAEVDRLIRNKVVGRSAHQDPGHVHCSDVQSIDVYSHKICLHRQTKHLI